MKYIKCNLLANLIQFISFFCTKGIGGTSFWLQEIYFSFIKKE